MDVPIRRDVEDRLYRKDVIHVEDFLQGPALINPPELVDPREVVVHGRRVVAQPVPHA